jgi:hypothetical protein
MAWLPFRQVLPDLRATSGICPSSTDLNPSRIGVGEMG